MAPRVIALSTAALQQFFPNDEHINPTTEDVVYTLEHAYAFGGTVPAYRDPAHLAAWLYGFAAADNLFIEQMNNNQEDK